MHPIRLLATAASLAASLVVPVAHAAQAAQTAECRPHLENAWLRMPPGPAGMMLAGFVRIANPCRAPVVIEGAASPAFGDVSLHETTLVDGVSRMRPVPALRIAPGASVELRPGGLHLMLMQPTQALKPGSRVPVEFRLSDGGVLRGQFEVRGFGG